MKSAVDIEHDVRAELEWEPSLNPERIRLAAHDGVITLTGAVRSYAEKLAAERAARRVQGVRAVADELEVVLAPDGEVDDTALAEAAAAALQWNSAVPADRLQVTVDHGWITLDGEADWQVQRRAAERAVRHLAGVRGVVNRIRIHPRSVADDVREKIEAALRRSAEIEARGIQVEVAGSTAILRGTVRSCAEREAAEWAAWAAPGITTIENHLQVAQESPAAA